jgi:hypothetical protein
MKASHTLGFGLVVELEHIGLYNRPVVFKKKFTWTSTCDVFSSDSLLRTEEPANRRAFNSYHLERTNSTNLAEKRPFALCT